ncbi:MAG: Gfo/Idh/MocA family oxidoreductase, partial [Candidatus Hydrogenedentes bacterium]|nr:Gfo/Idh/MocA family oxidoreductase [Candidatus Hydrogenedentota bacterium]
IAQDNGDTLRVGLIGCGGRGGGAVVNHLTGNDNVKFVAMADVFEDKLASKRKEIESNNDPKVQPKVAIEDELCFTGLDAYQKLLQTDIDIVIHATPPYARPTHITAAVEAGKHIFTEKPVAVDAPGIRQFMEAAKKAKEKGLSLVAGTQRRHQKSYVETVKKLQNGEIGEIVAARAYWCGTLPFSHERKEGWSDLEYRLRNWYNYCWVCGDNIVEQHIHNLDVINWVMDGHPVKVMASGGRAWKPLEERYGNIFDHFSCDYEYANGVHLASYSRHWDNSANEVSEFVVGTKGNSRCRDMGRDDMDPYVQEHIDLMASIRGTGPYLNEGIQVAESTFTAIIGREAAYTGKELKWDDALASDLSLVPKDLSFDKSYPMGEVPVPGTPRKSIA